MKTSDRGLMDIISHEAIVLTPYRDIAGIWTIGIGHTAAAGAPDPDGFDGQLTIADALSLFRRDIARYEARVSKAFALPLAQHEFDAAVSFDFNTGGIDRADWVKCFNAGDRDGAIAGIMNWRKPAAIIPRREREQRLFAIGVYGSDGTAMLYSASPQGAVIWSSGKRIDLAPHLSPAARRRGILAWLKRIFFRV